MHACLDTKVKKWKNYFDTEKLKRVKFITLNAGICHFVGESDEHCPVQ